MKIILTDILHRKGFDVYNILRRNYKRDEIVLFLDKPGAWRRFMAKVVYGGKIHDLNKASANDFSQAINTAGDLSDAVFIPVEEDSISLFLEGVDANLIRNKKYLLPSQNNFLLAADKLLLTRFCNQNDIPAPEEIDPFDSESEFRPFIAKPRRGSGSSGIVIVEFEKDLEKISGLRKDDFVFQSLLPDGKNVKGTFHLFHQGKQISAYGHQRIRTFPPEGGVTVYSRLDTTAEAIETGKLLLEKLNWNGLAMVETLYDPTEKKHKVIEVNPRLWGSILLSEFTGIHMLNDYVRLALSMDIKQHELKTKAYIRWIFPFDLIAYIRSGFRIKGFWNFNFSTTCYINMTYAGFWRSFFFILMGILDPASMRKFIRKIFNG